MKKLMSASLVRLMAGLLCCMFLSGCITFIGTSFSQQKRKLTETILEEPEGFFTLDKILLVDVSGFLDMVSSGGFFSSSDNAVETLKEILRKAEEDSRIRCIVLRINSPGGGVTTSDIMYQELKNFREKSGIPIVVHMMDLAASGGYMVAMAGDRIYAQPTTLTGSIGVISIYPDLEGLTGKIGVKMRVIKSGPVKDIGSIWRAFTSEERDILQQITNEYYRHFVETVVRGRPELSRSRIEELADGRVYTAQQALDAGLIDGVGHLPDTLKQARALAGIRDAAVVTYKRPYEFSENIYSSSGAKTPESDAASQVGFVNIDARGVSALPGPGFYYLWLP